MTRLLLFLAFAGACVGQELLPSGALQRGLIGYWTLDSKDAFDTTSMFNRATGGGKAVQVNAGTATNYVSGPFGLGAFAFDGSNDYIQTDVVQMATNAASMTLWMNSVTTATTARIVTGNDHVLGNEFVLQQFSGGVRGIVGGQFSQKVGGTVPVASGVWVHIGMTFDGSNLRLYTNGVIGDTTAASTRIGTNVQCFNLGIKEGGTLEPYHGLLSQVRVYNRVLSAAEIAQSATLSGTTMAGVNTAGLPYTVNHAPRPQVFYDLDIDSDVDDVADSVVMLNLERQGKLDIIGSVVTSTNAYAAPTWAAIASYYNRAAIQIGVNTTNCGASTSVYDSNTAAAFPVAGKTNAYNPDNFSDYRTVQRSILASASANSVEYLTTGDWSSMLGLLQTAGDGFSALDGPSLVAAKVRDWWCVGGTWPVGSAPVGGDLSGQCTNVVVAVMALWPTTVPIVFVDLASGLPVKTGKGVMAAMSNSNPAKFAWELFLGGGDQSYSAWAQIGIIPLAFGLGFGSEGNAIYSNAVCAHGSGLFNGAAATTWSTYPDKLQMFIYPAISATNYSGVINSWIRDYP